MTKENLNPPSDFEKRLRKACDGLVYVSETDSEVGPVFGTRAKSSSSADVLSAIGVSDLRQLKESDFNKFFERWTVEKEWFNQPQKKIAKRFQALKHLLESELIYLKVFRIGKIHVTIYVLGLDKDGKVAGIKMSAIET
jgi:hypothetical protein